MIIVEIAGHLGADPEVRFSPSGQKLTNLRIATTVRRQGKEETIWWRAVIFGDHLDKMISFLKKGSAVIVIGKMNPPQIYTDKNGQPQVQLELIAQMVEFSPFGKSDRSGQEQGAGQQSYGEPKPQFNRPQAAEPSFAAPSYGAPHEYEPAPHYAMPHQAPFAPAAQNLHRENSADGFPAEDTVPF